MKALLNVIVWISLVAITTSTWGQVPLNLQKDLQEADKYYYGGQFAKAISLYNTVFIRINPKNHQEISEIMKKLGDCYSKQGLVKFNLNDYEEAIIDLEKAVEMGVNDANVFYSIGVSKYCLNRYEEAILAFDKAINLNHSNNMYFLYRGNAKFYLKLYREAIIDLEKAVEMDGDHPNNCDMFNHIGVSKYHLQQYKEAILAFDKAIKRSSQEEYFVNRGNAKCKLNQYQEAYADYEKANTKCMSTIHFFINSETGNIINCNFVEQYKEAIIELNKAIKLNPNEKKYFAFRGSSKFDLGQYKDAIIDLEKAIEMGMNDAGVFNIIGLSKFNLKQYNEAIIAYDKAINLNPKEERYFSYRGIAKYKLNQYKEAFADYEKAIALGGSKGEFYDEVVKKLKESNAVAPIVIQKRFALVIANSKYKNLKNLEKQPQEDAKTIMPKLKACGFEVMVYYDITTKTEMQKAIIDFSIKAKNAEIVLVYYGGHGIEFSGKNYLLPTDISLTKQEYTKADAVALEDDLLLGISECHAALNLVVLDACRVNPFEDTNTTRGDDYRGMKAIPSSYTDIVVFYATSQGRVAKNDGRFAKSFAENLNKGVTLSDFMIDVTNNVKSSSDGSQLPYQAGSISKKLQF